MGDSYTGSKDEDVAEFRVKLVFSQTIASDRDLKTTTAETDTIDEEDVPFPALPARAEEAPRRAIEDGAAEEDGAAPVPIKLEPGTTEYFKATAPQAHCRAVRRQEQKRL